MRKINVKIIALLGIAFTLSCASPKLTNANRGLFKVMPLPSENAKNIVDLNVTIIPIPTTVRTPSENAKTFFDLNDSTQNVYIRTLSKMVKSPKELIDYIKTPLSDVKSASRVYQTNYTRIPVRFSIATMKNYHKYDKFKEFSKERDETFLHVNTRLDYLSTQLNLGNTEYLEILTIDKLDNVFNEIDLGTLNRTNTVTVNAKLSGQAGAESSTNTVTNNESGEQAEPNTQTVVNEYDEFGNLIRSYTTSQANTASGSNSEAVTRNNALNNSVSGEVSYNNEDVLQEALVSKIRRLKTGFAFTRDQIKIAQRGDILRDISDNVFVTATLEAQNKITTESPVFAFGDLFKNGIEQQACELSYNRRVIQYIPCTPEIFNGLEVPISIDVEGVIRAVENGRNGRNNYEYDDKVINHVFEYSETLDDVKVSFIPYCKKVVRITVKFKGDNRFYPLLIEQSNTTTQVQFLEDEDPLKFVEWIDQMKENPTAAKLQRNDLRLFFDYPKNAKRTYLMNRKITRTDITNLKTIEGVYTEIIDYGLQ